MTLNRRVIIEETLYGQPYVMLVAVDDCQLEFHAVRAASVDSA